MEAKYQDWIRQNVVSDGYGACHEYAEKMVAQFPELAYRKGWYYCLLWGQRMHGWCVTMDGEIVDPTVRQFPSKGRGRYEEIEDEELPTGKCMECGELLFGGGGALGFCNSLCHDAFGAGLTDATYRC